MSDPKAAYRVIPKERVGIKVVGDGTLPRDENEGGYNMINYNSGPDIQMGLRMIN